MKTSGSFWVRLLLFSVSVPIVYVVIFVLPQLNHLVMNLFVFALAVLGARETENLLAQRELPFNRGFSYLSATIPIVTYLEMAGLISLKVTVLWSIVLIMVALLRSIWVRSKRDIELVIPQLTSSLLVLFYPALFLSFLVRLTAMPRSAVVLLLFFCLMFGIDTCAYVFGMILGRKSLGLPISPNKTAAGFAGGLVAGMGIVLVFKFAFRDFLTLGIGACLFFGAGIGLLAITGDLVESSLKRSAGVKDSGFIIPGRGGVLDSIDSWMLSLPVFYFVLSML